MPTCAGRFRCHEKKPALDDDAGFLSPHLRRWIFLLRMVADFHGAVILRCTTQKMGEKKPALQSIAG